MNTVLVPDHPLDSTIENRLTTTCDTWRVAPGSHLAIALDRDVGPRPVTVRSGTFEVDRDDGVGTLTMVIDVVDGGTLRGVATRGARDGHGVAVWTVRGTLRTGSRHVPVTLVLRDHGVTQRRGTWWWLSGTGDVRCRRRRRPGHGSQLVADLLLVP